jgi:hypothetical protein
MKRIGRIVLLVALTEGSQFHTEQYLVGTVRLERNRLVISLPDGTVVKRYHPTTHPIGLCQ